MDLTGVLLRHNWLSPVIDPSLNVDSVKVSGTKIIQTNHSNPGERKWKESELKKVTKTRPVQTLAAGLSSVPELSLNVPHGHVEDMDVIFAQSRQLRVGASQTSCTVSQVPL